MAENKAKCNLLIISEDMEWVKIFITGISKFYQLGKEVVFPTLEEAEARIAAGGLDAMIVGADAGKQLALLKSFALQQENHTLILAVAPEAQKKDVYLQQGADFVVGRRDMLNAIHSVQQIMQLHYLQTENQRLTLGKERIDTLYHHLYHEFPEPICYLQDGLFLEANRAFLETFKIPNLEALSDITVISLVSAREQKDFKALMKAAQQKENVGAQSFNLEDREGEKHSVSVVMSRVKYSEISALQVILRSEQTATGGSLGFDAATGLPERVAFNANIATLQKQAPAEAYLGVWVLMWLENYREVLQKDGIKTAEHLLQATLEMTRRLLPPSTEMARFGDDNLLFYLPGDKEMTIRRFENLVVKLDDFVPENIGRLIHPQVFAGMQELRQDSDLDGLLERSFRATRGLALSQGQERIAEPASAEMSRKDERRVYQINKILEEDRLVLKYQPICALKPDGVPRYCDQLEILPAQEETDDEEIELDSLLQVADRYELGREIERVKMIRFMRDFLAYSGDQSALLMYLSMLEDALRDATFPAWLHNQLAQTGVKPAQVVFCLSLDAILNAYSGCEQLIATMRPQGSTFAVCELGRFDEEIEEILQRIKPEVLMLDLQEIDTFEDDEEERFMTKVKEYAEAHQVMLIAEHLQSPAELSRIWPYDINYIQGTGLVDPMPGFNYDFNAPLF